MENTPTKLHIMNTPDTTQTAGQTAHSPLPLKLATNLQDGRGRLESSIEFSNGHRLNISQQVNGSDYPTLNGNIQTIIAGANNHDKLVAALKLCTHVLNIERERGQKIANALLASLQS